MNNALGKHIFHRYSKETILSLYQHWFRLFSIFAQLGFFCYCSINKPEAKCLLQDDNTLSSILSLWRFAVWKLYTHSKLL